MGKACIITPGINKDLSGEPSVLYSNLRNYLQNRESALALYSILRQDAVKKQILQKIKDKGGKVEFDKNGELTIDAISQVLSLKDFSKTTNLSIEKKEVGAIDKQGHRIIYDTFQEVYNKCYNYNEYSSDKSIIAIPLKYGNNYTIDVVYADDESREKYNGVKYKTLLNQRLLTILHSLGIEAVYDANETNGRFSPLEAELLANGLKVLIRMSKGEEGDSVFPEEVAHTLIRGLKYHPLVQRLLASIDENTMRDVLGDEYEQNLAKYEGDIELMKEETAGRLLAEEFKKRGNLEENNTKENNNNEIIENTNNSEKGFIKKIISRIKNYILNLIKNKKLTEEEIDTVIRESKESAGLVTKLTDIIFDNNELGKYFNMEAASSGRTMHHVKESENLLKEYSEELSRKVSHLIYLKYKTLRSKKMSTSDKNTLHSINKNLEKENYCANISETLKAITDELEDILEAKQSALEAVSKNINIDKIRIISHALNRYKEFKKGFQGILVDISELYDAINNDTYDYKNLGFDSKEEALENVKKLSNSATILLNTLNNPTEIKSEERLTKTVVTEWIKLILGDKKYVWTMGANAGKEITVEEILTSNRDSTILESYLSSIATSSDMLLNVIAKGAKDVVLQRNQELLDIKTNLRAIHNKFRGDTSFMLERDSKGKKTGRFISNINWDAFNEDRQKYRKSLLEKYKAKQITYKKMEELLAIWDNEHKKEYNYFGKLEVLPIHDPGTKYYKNNLGKLTESQKEYYREIMTCKAAMDNRYPNKTTYLFRAVQIMESTISSLLDSQGNPIDVLKNTGKGFADNFVKRTDDTEWGQTELNDDDEEEDEESKKKKDKEGYIHVNTGIDDTLLETVPIYYTRRLKDMDRLSEDITGSMMAYSAAAVNYSYMSGLDDILKVVQTYMDAREVSKNYGVNSTIATFKIAGHQFFKEYTERGGRSAKWLENFRKTVIYGKAKQDQGTVLGKIDVAKLGDAVKAYSGIVGLGLNFFSGMANITVGKLQMFIETVAANYYTAGNMAKADSLYFKNLIECISESYATDKKNKLSLLIEKYDALEEFYEDMFKQGAYRGATNRVLNGTSVMILNNIGEHYLHSCTMLAMLDHIKVKVNNKESTVYDALEVKEIIKDGKIVAHELIFKDGTTDIDGNVLYNNKLDTEYATLINKKGKKTEEELKRIQEIENIEKNTNAFNRDIISRIGAVNQQLNGAFNQFDKGQIHRNVFGRLAMQFRQWMPAHYERRFGKLYHNFINNETMEGYYRTTGRFIWSLIKDLRQAQFDIVKEWNNLSKEERRNCRKAFFELGLFAIFSLISLMCGGEGDDDDKDTAVDLLLYNMERMKLEIGASIPLPSIIFNFYTIMQSPIAATKAIGGIIDLLSFHLLFSEIESGKYKGYTEYSVKAVRNLPIIGQTKKLIDFIDGERYLFNIFK